MSLDDDASGGAAVVTQRNLWESIELRRRARAAADEAKAHHLAVVARLRAGEACEPGRYRPIVAMVEEMLGFAIFDGEKVDRKPIPMGWFNPGEIRDARRSPPQAEAHAEAKAEAEAEA